LLEQTVVTTTVAPTTEAALADVEPAEAVTAVRVRRIGSGEEHVHEQFLAIIAANYPDWAASTEAGVTAGKRKRCDPRRPPSVIAATAPGPPAGPGQCVLPGRVGTIRQQRHRPSQRSPPSRTPSSPPTASTAQLTNGGDSSTTIPHDI
jgi:hypothetical protein